MLCAFFTQMWRWTFPNRKLFFFGVIRISAEPFVSHFYRKNMKTKYFNRQYLTAFGSNTPTIFAVWFVFVHSLSFEKPFHVFYYLCHYEGLWVFFLCFFSSLTHFYFLPLQKHALARFNVLEYCKLVVQWHTHTPTIPVEL